MQLEKIQHTLPKIPELVMQTLITAIARVSAGVPCHSGIPGRH